MSGDKGDPTWIRIASAYDENGDDAVKNSFSRYLITFAAAVCADLSSIQEMWDKDALNASMMSDTRSINPVLRAVTG